MNKVSKLWNVMLYIFVIGLVLSFLLLFYYSKKLTPSLREYGEAEVRRIVTLIINSSVSKSVSSIDSDTLFTRGTYNESNDISFDMKKIMELVSSITDLVQDNLNYIQKGDIDHLDIDFNSVSRIDYEMIEEGVVYYFSSGSFYGNTLLANVGPKIPIRFSMLGDIVNDVDSEVKEYGINSALVEVRVQFEVRMLIVMPFTSKEVKVESSVPIVMKIVEGNVPESYIGGYGNG